MRTRRSPIVVSVATLLVVAVAACDRAPVSPAGPTAPSSTPSNAVRPLDEPDVPIEAGRYRYEEFEVPHTFAVGDGWRVQHLLPEFYDVARPEVTVAFAHPVWMQGGGGRFETRDADQALQVLLDRTDLRPEASGLEQVGDRLADTVTLRLAESTVLFGSAHGQYMAEPGTLRVSALVVDGQLLLVLEIVTGALDEADARSAELLASVELPEPVSVVSEVERFDVGGYPNGVAAANAVLWIADPAASVLHRFDPQTGEVGATVPAGEGAFLLRYVHGTLWVSDHLAGTVSRRDAVTGSLVSSVEVGGNPGDLVPSGPGVWVPHGGSVSYVNIEGAEVVRSLDVGTEVQGLEARAGSVWVTEYPGSSVRRLDAESGELRGELDPGAGAWGLRLAGGRLWTANRTDGSLSAIGPDGEAAVVDLPDGAAPMTLFLLDGRLWATDVEQGLIYEVDPFAGALVAVHEVPSPVIQMTGTGDAVWAACGDARALVRLAR
jgi:streptogramin lyase